MADLDDTMTIAGEQMPDKARWTCHDHVHRKDIQTAREIGEPDPNWSYTDAEGHFHAWATDLDGKPSTPTLIGKPKMIRCENGPDCEAGCVATGGHWENVAQHCSTCDEEIEPGMRGTGRYSTSIVVGVDSEIRLTVPLDVAPSWLLAHLRLDGTARGLHTLLQAHGVIDGVTRFGSMRVDGLNLLRQRSDATVIEATLYGALHRGLARTPAGAHRG